VSRTCPSTEICLDGCRWSPRDRARPCVGAVVFIADSAHADEVADEAERPAGDPRYRHLARRDGAVRRSRRLVLGQLDRAPVLPLLRRPVWLRHRFALARVRARHRLQDPLDERCGLPHRVVHDHARAHGLALEPYPASHRYANRRPRPGDRGDASAAARQDHRQLLRPGRRAGRLLSHVPARRRQVDKRGRPSSRR
jgi:hypothetical protein